MDENDLRLIKQFDGKYCLVRTRGAGVHVGIIEELIGRRVVMRDARRIFRWRGANTLNELSVEGADLESFTRISNPVKEICLLTVTEIIECTPEAQANLSQSRWLE